MVLVGTSMYARPGTTNAHAHARTRHIRTYAPAHPRTRYARPGTTNKHTRAHMRTRTRTPAHTRTRASAHTRHAPLHLLLNRLEPQGPRLLHVEIKLEQLLAVHVFAMLHKQGLFDQGHTHRGKGGRGDCDRVMAGWDKTRHVW
jgi:hypothetical protein